MALLLLGACELKEVKVPVVRHENLHILLARHAELVLRKASVDVIPLYLPQPLN